jgi:hypothetical protein
MVDTRTAQPFGLPAFQEIDWSPHLLSLFRDGLRTVLAVKGSLRRA